MNREELIRKATLAQNSAEIRTEFLEYIVKVSRGTVVEDKAIRGMLQLIGEMDSWIEDYERELNRKKA